MNKKQLIARIQKYMGPGATRKTATAALDAVLSAVVSATSPTTDRTIQPKAHIPHLGTFQRQPRRMGMRLTFRPATDLLAALQRGNNRCLLS